MDITQIIVSALGFLGVAYGVYKGSQTRRYEIDTDRVREAAKHTTDADRRIDEKRTELN